MAAPPAPLLLGCLCCCSLLLDDQPLLLRPGRNLGVQLGLQNGQVQGGDEEECRTDYP